MIFNHVLIFSLISIFKVNSWLNNFSRKMSKFEVVQTEYGKVRGVQKISAINTPYNAFLGIPYAAPPVKKLRFKVSQY